MPISPCWMFRGCLICCPHCAVWWGNSKDRQQQEAPNSAGTGNKSHLTQHHSHPWSSSWECEGHDHQPVEVCNKVLSPGIAMTPGKSIQMIAQLKVRSSSNPEECITFILSHVTCGKGIPEDEWVHALEIVIVGLFYIMFGLSFLTRFPNTSEVFCSCWVFWSFWIHFGVTPGQNFTVMHRIGSGADFLIPTSIL